MRKIVVVLLLSFVGSPSLYAQIKFIPKIGSSFAYIRLGDDLTPDQGDVKAKFGVVSGLAADIPLSGDKISLQPELLFFQKGYRFSTSISGQSFKSRITFNYFELPVLVKMKFGKFYGVAGPSFSMGIGGNYKTIQSASGYKTTETGKVRFGKEPDNVDSDALYYGNRMDVGIQAGAGIQISVIAIELRYELGLLSAVDKPDNYTGDDYSLKNSAVLLTIGYPLTLKK